MKINELVKKAHQAAKEKGFYQNHRNVSELLMLIVCELSEACEALRKEKMIYKFLNPEDSYYDNKLNYIQFELEIKDTFQDEIADTFIRLADLCGYLKIDIEKFIIAKIEYNKTRPHKHGKEF